MKRSGKLICDWLAFTQSVKTFLSHVSAPQRAGSEEEGSNQVDPLACPVDQAASCPSQ